ncbi:MAG TPA: YqiA/YcfP family alpha/beta fold hydrolase [Vicinamibacterales bacterium]
MHVFYLHGFASSAQSSKAAFFASKLKAHGLALEAPDFNEPDFHSMTITRMIDRTGAAIETAGEGPVVLIGSSVGGFVAVQAAMRWPSRVTQLVLLAPALDLRAERMSELGDRDLEAWKTSGETMVFHYGYGRVMPIGYGLYEDARQYDSMHAAVSIPIQIFQGTRDEAVSPKVVEQWVAARPNVELHLLDDNHQLLGSLDYIWNHASAFLHLL